MNFNQFRSDVLKALRANGVQGTLTDADYSEIKRNFDLFNMIKPDDLNPTDLGDLAKGLISASVSVIQERHAATTIVAARKAYIAKPLLGSAAASNLLQAPTPVDVAQHVAQPVVLGSMYDGGFANPHATQNSSPYDDFTRSSDEASTQSAPSPIILDQQPTRKPRLGENGRGVDAQVAAAAPAPAPISVPPAGLAPDEGLPEPLAYKSAPPVKVTATGPYAGFPAAPMVMGITPPAPAAGGYGSYDIGAGLGYAPYNASSVAANSHPMPVSVYPQPAPVVVQRQASAQQNDSGCWACTFACCKATDNFSRVLQGAANIHAQQAMLERARRGEPLSQQQMIAGAYSGQRGPMGRVGDAYAMRGFCAAGAECLAGTANLCARLPEACSTGIGRLTACCGIFGGALRGCAENVGPCLEGTGDCLQATVQGAGQALECCGAVGACCCGVLDALGGGRR